MKSKLAFYPIIRQYTTANRVIHVYTTGGDQMVSNLLGKKYTHVTSNKSLTPCVKSFIRGKALGTRFARARALHPL